MMPVRTAVGVALVYTTLTGCQHIPQKPLYLDEIRASLSERPLEIEPIEAFARNLLSANETEATEFSTVDGLTLHEARAVGLWYNLNLRKARLAVTHADEIARTSGRWADPDVNISVGKQRVESEDTGTDSGRRAAGRNAIERNWIGKGGIGVTIPLSGRPRAEKRYQETAADVARLAALEAEWRFLANLEEHWLAWSAAEAHIELLDDFLTALKPYRDMAAPLAAAGELPPGSARLFAIEYDRDVARRARAAGEAASEKVALLGLIGLSPDAPVELIPSLAGAAPTEAATITAEHPALVRARGDYDLTERALRVELRKQYPDITLSPSFSDEGDESALVLGLGFPIPVWNANRQGIAEAAAKRDRARLDVTGLYHELLVELDRDRSTWQGAKTAWSHLSENVADVLDTQLSESLTLLRLGELNVGLMHGVLTQSLQTKQELLDALLTMRTAATHMAAATAPYTATTATTEVDQ
jgi:outer membrane protein, heavy metal efflux system